MLLSVLLLLLSFPFLTLTMRLPSAEKRTPLIVLAIFVNIYALINVASFVWVEFPAWLYSLAEVVCAFILSLSILIFSLRVSKYNQRSLFHIKIEKLVSMMAVVFWLPVILLPSLGNILNGRLFLAAGVSAEMNGYIVVYGLSIISFFIIFQIFLDSNYFHFPESFLALTGAVLPTAVLFIYGSLFAGQLPSDIFILALMISGYQSLYLVQNEKLQGQLGLSRESVIDYMDDGWMVLDESDRIQDMNPAAARMIGRTTEDVLGETINQILPEFPIKENLNQEIEMRKSLKLKDGWRYLNVRTFPLQDQKRTRLGRLMIWRDITDRKITENARQRARDEMFVLLNSISNAASQSLSLEDFLSESIFQLVYPFSSQLVLIFLNDERKQEADNPKLFLAAKYGVSAGITGNTEGFFVNSQVFQEVSSAGRSVNFSAGDAVVREVFSDYLTDVSRILLVPLSIRSKNSQRSIGFMLLGRQEDQIYSGDEVVKIETLASQIAITVDSDRKKKLAIVVSERQRLLRDLHDSVSQKLYGLVTLTEAVQAAREAGAELNLTNYLARIGENARQAVKEMRLFLYQLQPVDIEKEGLVSVLHYRLAAVEGRADIKARLLADDDIRLSGEKQITLFFVAQEALNNVLRHAQAREVTVTLKQGRKHVHLHIMDDGRGFDPGKLEKGGLGLNNMWERVLLVGGTFRIRSKPGEGTMILVSVPLEN